MKNNNVCSGGDTLIFACSGAADVGRLADLSAREMTQQGAGQMFCLAGIGGGVEPILKKTAAATKILAIDGCGLNCVKSCLEKAGFDKFIHLQLGNIDMVKGQSPPTEDKVIKAVNACKTMLEN